MRKSMLTLAAVLISAATINAQTYLEGTVSDSKSGDVLPFVNIAIPGTTTGTISDVNGEFKITVPESLSGKDLSFSMVGYSPSTIRVADASGKHLEVRLQPMDLNIEEVVVMDKSEAGRKVVKNVLDNVSSKYVDTDFAYSGTYSNKVTQGGSTRVADYSFNAYDANGYSRGASNNAFADLNYKFSSVKRDFKVNNYQLGLNYFDFVSGLDFVRYQLGVMNSFTLGDFDFRIKTESAEYYIIEFNCNKPSLLNTGAYSPKKYSGTITIQKSSNVVLESEYQLDVANLNINGMSLMNGAKGCNGVVKCKLTYGSYGGKYAIKSISSTISIKGGADGDITITDNIEVSSLNHKVPGKIFGKVFYTR